MSKRDIDDFDHVGNISRTRAVNVGALLRAGGVLDAGDATEGNVNEPHNIEHVDNVNA